MAIIPIDQLPDEEVKSNIIPIDELPDDSAATEPEANGPTVGSEALKIAGRGLAGASQGILDIGETSPVEAIGGIPASYMEKGSKLVSQDQIKSAIQKFVMSGSTGLVDAINNAPVESINSKLGLSPLLPQPETVVGRALGMAANIAGSALTGGRAFGITPRSVKQAVKSGTTLGMESKLTKANVRLPSSLEIEQAIKGVVDSNAELVNKNLVSKTELYDSLDVNQLNYKIRDSANIQKLEEIKNNLSFDAAEEISGTPGGNIGLGLKASKNLNEKYWQEVKPYYNAEKYVEDLRGNIESTLQNHGVMDAAGKLVEGAEISRDHSKLLKLYEKMAPEVKEGVVDLGADLRKIKVGEFRTMLEETLGKGDGANNLAVDVFQEAGKDVKGLKAITASYAPKYQIRNAVFDKFNIFNRIGWRRGEASRNSGASAIDNVANIDPSKINLDNVKMFDFIKEYTGKDPSSSVKSISGGIKKIMEESSARDIKSKIMKQDMARNIFKSEQSSFIKSKEMIDTLQRLKISAKIKETKTAALQRAATVAGSTIAGGLAGGIGSKLFSVAKNLSE